MGLGCGKAYLPNEDELVTARREKAAQQKQPQDEGEATAPSDPAEGSQKPKKKKKPEHDMISDILKRASAGSTEEQLAAALAAPDDASDKDEGANDEDIYKALLGPSSPSRAVPGAQVTAPPAGTRQPAGAPPAAASGRASSSSAKEKVPRHSPRLVQHAARMGVPLPSEEDDEYGLLDEYVDDLLGIPDAQRPNSWQRPSMAETEASLKGTMPHIIFGDGRSGPPVGPKPVREGLVEAEAVTPTKVSDGRRPSLVPPPGSAAASAASSAYMSGVIGGWATIDSQEITLRVAEDDRPAPKRKAAKAG